MTQVHQGLILYITITVFIIGCAGAPTQEMSDARQAINAARDVEADYYMPALWVKIEQNLAQAEQKLEAGKFKSARLFATLTKEQAASAHNMAVAIGRAKTIWQTITALGNSVPEMRILLEKAQLSAHQGNADKAIKFANDAYHQGLLALNQTRLNQAKNLIDKMKARKESLPFEEQAILDLAQAALKRKEGEKAYELIKKLFEKQPEK